MNGAAEPVARPNDKLDRAAIRRDIWNVPNVLTLGRIALIPVVCWLLTKADPSSCVWAAWLFGAAAFTDWLDGYLARKLKLESLTGKFLDPLADKLLVMAVFVILVPQHRIPEWYVIISLSREIAITALRALAAGEGIIIAAEWGGKWKTAYQLVGLICLMLHYEYTVPFWGVDLHIRFHHIGFAMLLLSLGYSLSSSWTYFRGFIRAIGEPDPTSL